MQLCFAHFVWAPPCRKNLAALNSKAPSVKMVPIHSTGPHHSIGSIMIVMALIIVWGVIGLLTDYMIALILCGIITTVSMVALGIMIHTGRSICSEMADFRPHRFGNIYFAYPDVIELMSDKPEFKSFCFWLKTVLNITIAFNLASILYISWLFIFHT